MYNNNKLQMSINIERFKITQGCAGLQQRLVFPFPPLHTLF